MHKALGAVLSMLLVATPLCLLLGAFKTESESPFWRLPQHRFLEQLRRQPSRFGALADAHYRQIFFGKVVSGTSAVVSAIPGATVHTAGAALVSMRYASVEGLRTVLQKSEAGYLTSRAILDSFSEKIAALYRSIPRYWEVKAIVLHSVNRTVGLGQDAWEWIGPGGHLHPEEFLEKYHGHLVIESLLAVVIGYLFFQQSFKWSKKSTKPLTEEEIDVLCEEWKPEPLHKSLPETQYIHEPPVISSKIGTYVTVEGKSVLNMVAYNFLGAAGDPKILEACQATVSKYGVGACGPRGFYGTIDVHLELEELLAKFMGREEAIIYSYDLSTIPSVLPAFANARDLLVIDETAEYGIQNGANLSRAKVVTFKHNDIEDLERVLRSEVAQHERLKKPLNRRFIVVESISKALGDVAPLAEMCKLKHKYKFRLVVDESLALGVMGSKGRGACEHFGLSENDVEIICASMGNSLASVGGFCVGTREIVDHQRLSGLGYCFSAALPPFLATAAKGALEIITSPTEGPSRRERLLSNARLLRASLADLDELEVVAGGEDNVRSPVVLVTPTQSHRSEPDQALQALQEIVNRALKDHSVLLTVAKYSALDKVQVPPSIRLVVTAFHSHDDIKKAVQALKKASQSVLTTRA